MEWMLRETELSLERLDGEIIAIDFQSGKYGSFVGPSADLLWLVQSEVPYSKWMRLIEDSYSTVPLPNVMEEQIDSFLKELAELGILQRKVGGPEKLVESLPEDCVRGDWTVPVYAIEDDLVDLLTIDPIHDTSGDGWPQATTT